MSFNLFGPRRPPPPWSLLAGALAIAAITSACSHGGTDASGASGGEDAPISADAPSRRDIAAMMRAKYGHQACEANVDCPFGTHCDGDASACTYECVSSDGCDPGMACNDAGVCVHSLSRFIDIQSPTCAGKNPADIISALEVLNDDPNKCKIDADCICGAYCNNLTRFCQVDCVTGDTSGNLTCDTGQTCNGIGQCVSVSDPGPTVQLTLAMAPAAVTGDTFAATVLVPVTVSVDAVSPDVIAAHNPHPAKVLYHFVGIDDPALPNTPSSPAGDPATQPKLKCSDGAALATSCEVDGGWAFDGAGNLHATPRTIWVQLPQSATVQTWTLQATSDWAAEPLSVSVAAAPIVPPPAIAGHYTGELTVTHAGAPLTVPVDAVVTNGNVALVEASKIFLPDGHAVFSRTAGKVTMLSWLSSSVGTGSHYDVRFQLGALAQDAKTGQLTFGPSTLTAGDGVAAPVALTLGRTGDLEPAACTTSSCGTGNYCDTTLARCLPGSGPAGGAGIVDQTATAASPSTTLASSQVAAWASPLASLAAAHPGVLDKTGTAGISSAYCAHTAIDLAPPLFNVPPFVTSSVSLDSECALAGTPYVEQTFPFAERTKEVETGSDGGDSFVLSDTCTAELAANPVAALSDAKCVSLARFFLALKANVVSGVGQPGSDTQQRLIWHVLRQWLGVNTYVASTTVRSQAYHDVLDADSVAPQTRLGQAVDRMEQSLLVLLDPTVRAQFAAGTAVDQVATSPDYRNVPRPVTRWTFNDHVSPAADAEGSNPFVAIGVNLSLAGGELSMTGESNVNVLQCHSSAPVALDETRFSITANLKYIPENGEPVLLFQKIGPSGSIELNATTSDFAQHVNLMLSDSNGGVANFVIPWSVTTGGMIGVVADSGTYRAYSARPGFAVSSTPATSVTGGGPRWSGPGTVNLACDAPSDGACTSWDRNIPGDGLDVGFINWNETSATLSWRCRTQGGRTTCSGTQPSTPFCVNTANARKAALPATFAAGAPAGAGSQLNVTGAQNIIDIQTDSESGITLTTTTWNCALAITKFPVPITAQKPICGADTDLVSIKWDEVSLWSRAVQLDEFTAMAASYGNTPSLETLPAKPGFDAKDEQRAGLPVYLLEAANAQLDLLRRYLEAEDAIVYSQCYTGNASSERGIATDRLGHNLRLLALLEGEAVRLAALADPAATWRARYQTDLQLLANRQDSVVQQLRTIGGCENTLHISDQEIPLYTGTGSDTSANARFYASSQYLVGLAEAEVSPTAGAAQLLLGQARSAYVAQRLSSFQTNRGTGSTESADRKNALTINYEDQLKRYCGAAPGDLAGNHPLLDGFRSGTLDETNCFFKIEQPGCTGLAATAFKDLPDTCLRGEIGERIIAIKSAAVDSDNATAAFSRASEAFDLQNTYCTSLRADADGAHADLVAHQDHMRSLNSESQTLGFISSLAKSAASIGATVATGGASSLVDFGAHALAGGGSQAGGGFGAVTSIVGLGLSLWGDNLQNRINEENDKYQLEVSDRQGDATVAACYHAADEQHFSLAAATDTITRATQESQAALFTVRDDMNTVAGIAGQAKGQLALEDSIDRTPPQFHYWLDQSIADYDKHMAYARRLTYLALRSYEYETQTDLNQRGAVLSARLPRDLEAVLHQITTSSSKIAGGLDTKVSGLTFSLRDEIMKVQPEGGRTAAQVFNDLLTSDAGEIFVGTGTSRHSLGHGIRFSIKPDQWNALFCDERIWRITPLATVTGGVPNLNTITLFQSNSFGSQSCTETPAVTMTRLQSNANLLSGDAPVNFSVPTAMFGTPITIDPTTTVAQIRALPDGNGIDASMAGRGLYGDYIIVFPACNPTAGCTSGFTDAKLKSITDVTIRFDTAYAGNTRVLTQ